MKTMKLVCSDLSNIEGRTAAWLAGEQWKLDAFAAVDRGVGHDMYKMAYARSFGVQVENVNDGDQRQVGKVQELALGYEGGVGAFLAFADVYRVNLQAMASAVIRNAPASLVDEARDMLAWSKAAGRSTYGLPDDVYIGCETVKRGWRKAHSATTAAWKDLKEAIWLAIEYRRKEQWRSIAIECDGKWLRLRLPSGRYLCYALPRVDDKGISYMGVNQYSRKWQRIRSYGGKFFENLCQAVARDIMAHNMMRIEEAGYEIQLTVHDEVVTEAPDNNNFNAKHLSSLLAAVPEWAPGLPLAAKGFESYRYVKG